jgi:hypothetical protein
MANDNAPFFNKAVERFAGARKLVEDADTEMHNARKELHSAFELLGLDADQQKHVLIMISAGMIVSMPE